MLLQMCMILTVRDMEAAGTHPCKVKEKSDPAVCHFHSTEAKADERADLPVKVLVGNGVSPGSLFHRLAPKIHQMSCTKPSAAAAAAAEAHQRMALNGSQRWAGSQQQNNNGRLQTR